MMVGRELKESSGRTGHFVTEWEALRVKGLNYAHVLKSVSFVLHRGEILGIAGLVGSGRTELAKCIIGDLRMTSGEIIVDGKPVGFPSVRWSLANGVVYASEDRKKEEGCSCPIRFLQTSLFRR